MAHRHPFSRRLHAASIAGLLSLTSGGAFASGFALIEQSVSSMGTAYAGSGSAAEDASFIYFNPASMSEMDGTQVSGGLHIVLPETEFSGTGTLNPAYQAGSGTIPPGTSSEDAGELGALPHFAYTREISDRMDFGLTINVPFGLKTEYNETWVGRYSSTAGEVRTVNINPALSFEIDEHVTLGFGLSVMYANLIFENVAHTNFPTFPGTDIPVKIDVDDWGFGWNFGALLKPTDSTRMGFAYRSKVDVELEGDRSSPFGIPGTSTDANVSLPDTLLLSVFHEVNDQWAVMADITWTQWSRIDALVFRFGDTTTNTIPVKFEDSYRYAVGATYRKDDRWKFRGGLAFDETPVPSPEFRLTALPDEDRTWLTIGAGYQYSKNLSFDIGYAHLFIADTRINSTDGYPSSVGGNPNPLKEGLHRVTGEYEASVDIISAQVNWKFD